MKKNYKLIVFLVGTIFISSCGVVKNSGKYHEKNVSNKNIYTDNLHADMEINEDQKITGDASATYFLFFRISGDEFKFHGFKNYNDFNNIKKIIISSNSNILNVNDNKYVFDDNVIWINDKS